ncbi:Nicotinamidase-related amidase [Desulfuromusa kysingii]|uniref:Nicotinamidase-related amidase n=1 Tax=Desulfuromusa kysingii TaxID=37625 RepID=A0A1H3VLP5_9BACT|nr:hydrolase [Desulfuromusa kysingii]SDZ75048.1 Nicotinamidase-related amidase [Desulfuromusa kysingii]
MGVVKDKFWLDAEKTALVIIDVQEKLAPAMNQSLYGQLIQHTNLLIEGFKALGLPIIATEQYPQGLGHTVTELPGVASQDCIEKMTFSCCGDDKFMAALEKSEAKQVLIVGMETHVCVFQTALDLLDRGYVVHLVSDALCSRFQSDYANAIKASARAGAVITTTETALFQLVKVAGTDSFKAISKLIRQRTA